MAVACVWCVCVRVCVRRARQVPRPIQCLTAPWRILWLPYTVYPPAPHTHPRTQFAFLYRRLASLFFPMFQMQIDVQRLALGTAFWKRMLLVELERRKAAAKARGR